MSIPSTSPLHVSLCTTQSSAGCCQTNDQPSSWLKTVDTLCRIALAAFATFLAPTCFAISLGIGFTLGVSYAITIYFQKESILSEGQGKPVCAQGYMDYLSGMRFPPIIGSVATASFIGAHMRHDTEFYVPFCGIFLGFWAGHQSAQLARGLATYIFTKASVKDDRKHACHCA